MKLDLCTGLVLGVVFLGFGSAESANAATQVVDWGDTISDEEWDDTNVWVEG